VEPAEASASGVLEESTMPAHVTATQLKPLRLNFAHVCIQCGDRWCTAPVCIERHDRSRWMVCPDCLGEMYRPDGDPCGCLYGLVETHPCPPARTEKRRACR
jgi:hypothetical protein